MIKAELLTDKDCPNVATARAQLKKALEQLGLEPLWQEWQVGDSSAPAYMQGLGSPSILINEKDVSGWEATEDNNCCRVYSNSSGGFQGTPTFESITEAIKVAMSSGRKSASGQISLNLAVLPSIGIALLPAVFCPACWPAYAGLLSSLGVGFINYTPFLLPGTILLLALSMLALAYGAKQRRGYMPLLMGLFAAALILAGKFIYDVNVLLYSGVAILIFASILNSWPEKPVCDTS